MFYRGMTRNEILPHATTWINITNMRVIKRHHKKTQMCESTYQFISVAQSCPTLCDPMDCSMPGFPVHHHLLKHAQTHVLQLVTPSSHIVLCCPLLLLPSILPSIKMSQFFTSGSQNMRDSASATVLPMNIQDWFPLGLTGLILQSKGLSRVFSKASILQSLAFFLVQLSYPHMTTGKNHSFDYDIPI